ncbi:MAG: DcaP family trimeric outer membrane transporter [Rhodocyclaceae bacterium]|nr:DcaP family trimeric outer membrane transporter [Rhodocyclaceae bacterium]
MDRIEQLEKAKTAAVAPAAAPAEAVTKGDIPGSFKLPGSNTSVALGGYVKGLATYSTRGPLGNPGSSDELFIPVVIPLSNAAPNTIRKNYWKESAKESRIVIRTHTPSDLGPINTLIEADFYGTPGNEATTNSHQLRLRHAWGTIGNFGFGQFWSNMANMTAVPETVDFTPQIGIFGGVRQTGIRWTQPTSFGFWSVAAENPEARIASTAGIVSGPDNDKIADFNGKVHFKAGPGEFEVVGAFRRPNTGEAALGTAPAPEEEYRKSGWGLGFSGYVRTIGDYDRLMFGISATRDMGRAQSGLLGDAVFVTSGTGAAKSGELRGIDTMGGFLSYRHRWSPTMRSTWAYSLLMADNPTGLTAAGRDTLDKRLWSTHLNLIWSPVPQVDFGIEYLHGGRTVESGKSGDLDRFLMAAKYKY